MLARQEGCDAVCAAAGFRGAAALRETEDRFSDAAAGGRFVATEKGEVYIREQGPEDGMPVLLVHGSVGWSKFWGGTSAALADAGFRAISFDMPPMGYSQPDATHDYRRVTQAARILALAEAMEIKPHLVAHSFGAGAATEAILRDQGAFSGFVIVNGALGLSMDPDKTLPWVARPLWVREIAVSLSITNPLALKPLLQQFLHRKEAATSEILNVLNEPFQLRGTTTNIAHWLPTLLVPPQGALSAAAENYSQIALPTGIVWGREDTATPLVQGEEINSLIPGSRLVVLDDLGHIPQIEGPAEFNAALIKILSGF
jgi:pimeloyl-ACP methyl ester carboxylesterase